MRIDNRFLSFGYDEGRSTFYIKTTDPEYLKIAKTSDDNKNEIIFEFSDNFLKQIFKMYDLYKSKNTYIPNNT